MADNKEYYKFFNSEIFEVDKDKNNTEKSIQLFLDYYRNFTVEGSTTMNIQDREVKNGLKYLSDDIHINYFIFDNIHIKDSYNSLINCQGFIFNLIINKKDKNIKIEKVKILYLHDTNFNGFKKKDDDGYIYFKNINDVEINYESENEIINLIHKEIKRVLYNLIIIEEIEIHKFLKEIDNVIEIKNFINLFNKIEDKKEIKNYLINKKFK